MSHPPKAFQSKREIHETKSSGGPGAMQERRRLQVRPWYLRELGMGVGFFVSREPKNLGRLDFGQLGPQFPLYKTIYRGYNFIYIWWFAFCGVIFEGLDLSLGRYFGALFSCGGRVMFFVVFLGVLWFIDVEIYHAKSPFFHQPLGRIWMFPKIVGPPNHPF